MVMDSNKNLGQYILERVKYKQLVWEHLKDNSTYKQISESEVNKIVYSAVSDFFNLARNT